MGFCRGGGRGRRFRGEVFELELLSLRFELRLGCVREIWAGGCGLLGATWAQTGVSVLLDSASESRTPV
jgi:hypothetical protein